jgi:hypothetical protein
VTAWKWFLSGAIVVLGGAAQGQEVSDVSLAQCETGRVLVKLSLDSLKRANDTGGRIAANWQQLGAISARHPEAPPDQPIQRALTKDEVAEFERVSGQIAVENLYALAESRRERDANVMMDMLTAAGAIRDGAAVPPAGSAAAEPYVYLLRLANALTNGPAHPDNRAPQVCSLDLALQLESGRSLVRDGEKLTSTPEYLELLGLRAKYGIPEGASIDVSKLSATDAERKPKLEAAIRGGVERLRFYDGAIGSVRFFADMSAIQYDELKSEALELGGSNNIAEFNALRGARRARLPNYMQAVWDAWDSIDAQAPSAKAKESAMVGAIVKGQK